MFRSIATLYIMPQNAVTNYDTISELDLYGKQINFTVSDVINRLCQ